MRIKEDVQYVFIHPGWRGAWAWDRVLRVMQAWGREAYAVDCPGHGTRIKEMESATLADYPAAVAEFIAKRELTNVALVGNSTGGLINQLTAQEIPEKIAHAVWYMAFLLKDGESILDACPPEFSAHLDSYTGNEYPVPPHEIIRARWMQDMRSEDQTTDLARWQPQPLRSFTDKPDLKRFYNDPRVQAIPKSFINGVKDVTFDWEYRKAWDPRLSGNITDFTYAEVPGSHCCFNCHPEDLALAVIELVEYDQRGEAYAVEELWRKAPGFYAGEAR
jgi:pimeloyl-ACP methyl ester carboxylesterase